MLKANAQSYSIFNATSTPEANGIYVEDGLNGDLPKYTNGEYTMFYTVNQNMRWAIVPNGTSLSSSDANTSPYVYSNMLDKDLPPVKIWHHGGNTIGVPGEFIIVAPINSMGYNKNFFCRIICR